MSIYGQIVDVELDSVAKMKKKKERRERAIDEKETSEVVTLKVEINLSKTFSSLYHTV